MSPAPIAPVLAATPRAGALAPTRSRFGPALEARLLEARPAAGALETGRPTAPGQGPGGVGAPLAAALRGVEAAQARLEAVLAGARRGQAFSAGQLLALQADAHRLTQTLDVAGKLVEQGVQSVKQAIQTPL